MRKAWLWIILTALLFISFFTTSNKLVWVALYGAISVVTFHVFFIVLQSARKLYRYLYVAAISLLVFPFAYIIVSSYTDRIWLIVVL